LGAAEFALAHAVRHRLLRNRTDATASSRLIWPALAPKRCASARQSDLLIVAGRVTSKMMPVLQHIYQQ